MKQLIQWGYKPKIPVNPNDFAIPEKRKDRINNKNMHAFNFYSDKQPLSEIDIVINYPINYQEIKSNAIILDFEGVQIPTICKKHLIKMKKYSGRA